MQCILLQVQKSYLRIFEIRDGICFLCEQHQIVIPDMDAQYVARRGRSRNQQYEISVEHYYRVDIFIATIDYQLQVLNRRSNEHSVEFLARSTTLDPRIDLSCSTLMRFTNLRRSSILMIFQSRN